MGKPKFSRKRYETPSHPWKEERIKNEDELVRKYGLKNKREVWKSETRLRKYRGEARRLLARVDSDDPQSKREIDQLLMHLTRMSILPPNSNLDDVLALENEKILSRRLQTQVYLKGLARTPNQARQLIIHGHIAVDGRKVTVPSYMVEKKEEDKISYTGNSPLNIAMHPERPQPKFQPGVKTTGKTETTEEKKIEKEKPVKETKEAEKKKDSKSSEKTEKKSSKEEETSEKPEEKNKEEPKKVEDKPVEKKEVKQENTEEKNKIQEKEDEVKTEEKKSEEKTEKKDEGGK